MKGTPRNCLLALILLACALTLPALPVHADDATDALFEAAESGTASEVKDALSAGADPGARDRSYGRTPLHWAAYRNGQPFRDSGIDRRRRGRAFEAGTEQDEHGGALPGVPERQGPAQGRRGADGDLPGCEKAPVELGISYIAETLIHTGYVKFGVTVCQLIFALDPFLNDRWLTLQFLINPFSSPLVYHVSP